MHSSLDEWFYGLPKLQTVVFNCESLKLCYRAFLNCSNLTTVSINPQLEDWWWRSEVFSNCLSLTTITVPKTYDYNWEYNTGWFSGSSNLVIKFQDGIKDLCKYCLNGTKGIKQIIIPDGVVSIGEYGFIGCEAQDGIEIPESVTQIGVNAFKDSKLVIHAKRDSYAARWARSRGFKVVYSDIRNVPLPKAKSNGTVTVSVGESIALIPEFAYTHDWAVKEFKSSRSSVIKVDKDGIVDAVSEGKAQITATTKNKKKATITVNVIDPYKPTKVSIEQGKTAKLGVGQTLKLDAVLAPETAKTALKWKSSNKRIATVGSNGTVTAKKKGQTKITVTTGNKKKATITIVVNK